ncbi:MAG: DUF1318 domain-containing protein [Phycisphaeraceae bacterium]|nr:DUF1318 domain-containing protein [Phycisphaeraceae bacterium]
MTSRTVILSGMLGMMLVAMMAGPVMAQQTDRDRARIIMERIQKRYPDLLEAKNDGFIGETRRGVVAIVPANRERIPANRREAIERLVRDETSDRQQLFPIWARMINAERDPDDPPVTAAHAAEIYRAQQYELARAGHWLMDPEGRWYQKR